MCFANVIMLQSYDEFFKFEQFWQNFFRDCPVFLEKGGIIYQKRSLMNKHGVPFQLYVESLIEQEFVRELVLVRLGMMAHSPHRLTGREH